MKVSITTKNEEINISEEVKESDLENKSFDLICPDFMLRVEYDEDNGWKVINAVDGWGNNCRDLFKGSLVEFFKIADQP